MQIVTNAVQVLLLVTQELRKTLSQSSDTNLVVKYAKVVKDLQEAVKKYERL